MSNPPVNVELVPSEAYREATGSLVYRLSELMFGSLLAAYSLGFVGALAAQGSQLSAHGRLGIVLLATQYICISIMFTYLTTSFYLTYHVGILTLPKLPFDRLGRDFTIAVLQAVFFGISMLQPALFPILLAINFFISGHRKNEEYKRLADGLFNQICEDKARALSSKALPKFREELAKRLRTKSHLSNWAPIRGDIQIYGVLALSFGVAVIGLCLALDYNKIAPQTSLLSSLERWELPPLLIEWLAQPLRTAWRFKQLLITVELLLATILIYVHGRGILERRASFIGFPSKSLDFCRYKVEAKVEDQAKTRDEKPQIDPQTNEGHKMDKEFEKLPEAVKEICEDLFAQS